MCVISAQATFSEAQPYVGSIRVEIETGAGAVLFAFRITFIVGSE